MLKILPLIRLENRNAATKPEPSARLFDPGNENVNLDEVVFVALGDFQHRGFELAGRRLALDRLLGAFRRTFERYGIPPLSDDEIAERLGHSGAFVERVPGYVAKHPYRITVPRGLAKSCLEKFESMIEHGASEHEVSA